MKKIDACKLRRKGGFTLVELIVVLVLLAVLSAVAVPTYLGYVDDNKAKQCETNRKALASRLEEMSAMGSTASLTEEVLNSDENGCPAGGHYELNDSPEGSDINSMTITCDKHGSTTVMLKNNSQVTAKSSTETEGKVEKEPETGKTEPPAPEAPAPKEPKVEIKIDPASVSLVPDASHDLTAQVINMEECTNIDNYQWDVTPKGVVALEGSGENVSIKATGSGFCTVTCTATATRDDGKGSIDSNVAKTNINVSNVSFSLPDEIMIPVWQQGKGKVNSKLFEELKNYGYDVPQGGWWSCPDPRVTEGRDWNYVTYDEATGQYIHDGGYIEIEDNDAAGNYALTYTYQGKSATMMCHVVYPVYELYSAGETGQNFSMELGDECEIETLYHWDNTTDGPMEWSCDNNEVINYSIVGGAKDNKVKVKATSVGTAVLTSSMLCKYNQATGKDPLYQTYPWTITVKYRTITGVTAETLVLQEGGDPQQIQFTPIPSEGTDPNVTYKCTSASVNSDYLEYTEDGWVTPKKECNATIYFEAILNGKQVGSGSCSVVVTSDPNKLAGVKFEPSRIELMQGETARITVGEDSSGEVKILPIPESANFTDVSFAYSSYRQDLAGVDENGVITAYQPGEATIYVTVKKDNTDYGGYVYVNVKQDPTRLQNFWINPNPITLDVNATKPFTIGANPEGVDLSGITFRYTPENSSILSIDAEKKEVTGLQYGTTKVKAEAVKNDTVLAECWFDVKVSKLTNMWVSPGQVTLTPGESTTVQVGYEPGDASNLVFDIAGINTDLFDYSVNGAYITITGKGQGDRWVAVQAKDTATGAVVYEVSLNVKVNRIKSISVNPNPVIFYPNEEVTVDFTVEPSGADLSGLKFELINRWDSNQPEFVRANIQDKTITLRAHGQTNVWYPRLSVKENDNELVGCDITTKVIPEGQLKGFRIEPSTIDLMQGETAQITIAPNLNGPIVIYPEPEGAALSLEQISSNHWNVQISGGVLTAGNNVGTQNVNLTAQGCTGSITIHIGYSKVTANNIDFSIAAWRTLKEYMRKKSNGEATDPLPESNIYASENSNSINCYFLKKGADLVWKEEYANMTFEEFLNQPGNRDLFYLIDLYNIIPSDGNRGWISAGAVVSKENAYYVYIGEGMSTPADSNWNENDFIKIK